MQDPMSSDDFDNIDIFLPENISSEEDLSQAFQYFISKYSLALNVIRYKYGFRARQRVLLCIHSILMFYQRHNRKVSGGCLTNEIERVFERVH